MKYVAIAMLAIILTVEHYKVFVRYAHSVLIDVVVLIVFF